MDFHQFCKMMDVTPEERQALLTILAAHRMRRLFEELGGNP